MIEKVSVARYPVLGKNNRGEYIKASEFEIVKSFYCNVSRSASSLSGLGATETFTLSGVRNVELITLTVRDIITDILTDDIIIINGYDYTIQGQIKIDADKDLYWQRQTIINIQRVVG